MKKERLKQAKGKKEPSRNKNIAEKKKFVVINILIEIREDTILKKQIHDALINNQSMEKKILLKIKHMRTQTFKIP